MQDYINSFEDIFNRLASMRSEIAEEMQVSMLLTSFGDENKSQFGHTISSIQNSSGTITWERATAKLLQEYEERSSRMGK